MHIAPRLRELMYSLDMTYHICINDPTKNLSDEEMERFKTHVRKEARNSDFKKRDIPTD